jgi:hypothetical protein
VVLLQYKYNASIFLQQALAEDMKLKLLTVMKDLLNQGLKIQTLQAWGWFIRLQGSHAMKYRHLTNDMLKVPEKTFSDHNPQVQIASLVFYVELLVLESCFAVVASSHLLYSFTQLHLETLRA